MMVFLSSLQEFMICVLRLVAGHTIGNADLAAFLRRRLNGGIWLSRSSPRNDSHHCRPAPWHIDAVMVPTPNSRAPPRSFGPLWDWQHFDLD